MASLAALLLRVVHLFYASLLAFRSLFDRLFPDAHPQSLFAPRCRIPKHLAILFAVDADLEVERVEDVLSASVIRVIEWSRLIGIERVTFYDEHGILLHCSENISNALSEPTSDSEVSEAEIQYPITPPPSDYDPESRSISPSNVWVQDMKTIVLELKERSAKFRSRKQAVRYRSQSRRYSELPVPFRHARYNASLQGPTVCFASRASSKPVIASVATHFASQRHCLLADSDSQIEVFELNINTLDQCLEGHNMSSPDFMIVHYLNQTRRHTLELHGFPPWHIRLTEIYHNRPAAGIDPFEPVSVPPLLPLDEMSFRRALDEFALAEMRFGK